ncbi:MAG: pentapeptide repeat-containing protein, partial [Prochlorococcus sp.]
MICPRCDLSQADLSTVTYLGRKLQYSNLKGANLQGSNLSNVVFMGSDFSGANLRHAVLSNTFFTGGANLEGADLRYSRMDGS